jgi:hypothetical protein
MKNHLCLVCGVLAGITILHFTAFAETARPSSTTSAPLSNAPGSEKLTKECEEEWMADKEGMMKRGMTEDRYVEQCRVKDDVPAIPEKKKNAAPSSTPK